MHSIVLSPISNRIPAAEGTKTRPDFQPDFIPDRIPNYGERLRRARMGLAVAMTPIVMLFISFTAVYLVRRGFLSFDASNGDYIRIWVPVQLAMGDIAGQYRRPDCEQRYDRTGAARDHARSRAWLPCNRFQAFRSATSGVFPWLALTTILGLLFLAGQLFAWSKLSAARFPSCGRHEQFFRLHAYRDARAASGWRSDGSSVCECCWLFCIVQWKRGALSSTLLHGIGIA